MATLLQKIATAKIAEAVENGGKVSVSKVMRESGYSPATAKNPEKLVKTIGFKEELASYNLTDDRYYKKIDEALEAKKWNDFTGEKEPDYKTQLPYHTKLGKLLGLEREENNFNLGVNLQVVTYVPDEENSIELPTTTETN